MKDFVPNDYVTIKLNDDDSIDLFANIQGAAAVRGAFFTEPDKRVTVSITGPSGRVF